MNDILSFGVVGISCASNALSVGYNGYMITYLTAEGI